MNTPKFNPNSANNTGLDIKSNLGKSLRTYIFAVLALLSPACGCGGIEDSTASGDPKDEGGEIIIPEEDGCRAEFLCLNTDRAPVEGCLMRDYANSASCITDKDGKCEGFLRNMGSHVVIAEKNKLNSIVQTVYCNEGEDLKISLVLEKNRADCDVEFLCLDETDAPLEGCVVDGEFDDGYRCITGNDGKCTDTLDYDKTIVPSADKHDFIWQGGGRLHCGDDKELKAVIRMKAND